MTDDKFSVGYFSGAAKSVAAMRSTAFLSGMLALAGRAGERYTRRGAIPSDPWHTTPAPPDAEGNIIPSGFMSPRSPKGEPSRCETREGRHIPTPGPRKTIPLAFAPPIAALARAAPLQPATALSARSTDFYAMTFLALSPMASA